MAYLFPRFAVAPVRCAPIRHEIAPLWSLFDDATRQIQRLERHTRRAQFNPRFDLREDKEFYVLEGEVPGFKEGDLSIEWKDNTLAIRGHHESVTESGKKPEAVQAPLEQAAIPDAAPESDTSSVKSSSTKSYQATVEDEEPANGSAVAQQESSTEKQQVATPVQQTTPAPEEPAANVQHWISERRSGQFTRQFSFPSNKVNHEAIRASLESGILKIVVPKAPVPESRRIFIE